MVPIISSDTFWHLRVFLPRNHNTRKEKSIQGVIKKYGECLNKKNIITVKDTLPLIPLKTPPLALNTLIPSFLPLPEAILEVLFRECL